MFISSPGDLAPERALIRNIVEGTADEPVSGPSIKFKVLGWETLDRTEELRTQGRINELIDQADIVFVMLYRRWGQAAPDSFYSSYTEEEYFWARARQAICAKPRVVLCFKSFESDGSDSRFVDDVRKIKSFQRQVEAEHTRLYYQFVGSGELEAIVREVLSRETERQPSEGKQNAPPASRSTNEAGLPSFFDNRAPDFSPLAFSVGLPLQVRSTPTRLESETVELNWVTTASDFYTTGKNTEARNALARVARETESTVVLEAVVDVCQSRGETSLARSAIERWLALAVKLEDEKPLFIAHHRMAELYLDEGHLDLADRHFKAAVEIASRHNDDHVLRGLLYGCINQCLHRGRLKDACDGAALLMAQESKEEGVERVIAMKTLRANVFAEIGQTKEAEATFRDALKLLPPNAHNVAGPLYGNYSAMLRRLRRHAESHSAAESSLRAYRAAGSKHGELTAELVLATIELAMKQTDLARSRLEMVLFSAENLGFRSLEAKAAGNLGVLLSQSGNEDLALKLHHRSLELHMRLGHRGAVARDCANLGASYVRREEFRVGAGWYLHGYEINKLSGRPEGEAICLAGAARCLVQLREGEQAVRCASLALSRSLDSANANLAKDVLDTLLDVLRRMEDQVRAFTFAKSFAAELGARSAWPEAGRLWLRCAEASVLTSTADAIDSLVQSKQCYERAGDVASARFVADRIRALLK